MYTNETRNGSNLQSTRACLEQYACRGCCDFFRFVIFLYCRSAARKKPDTQTTRKETKQTRSIINRLSCAKWGTVNRCTALTTRKIREPMWHNNNNNNRGLHVRGKPATCCAWSPSTRAVVQNNNDARAVNVRLNISGHDVIRFHVATPFNREGRIYNAWGKNLHLYISRSNDCKMYVISTAKPVVSSATAKCVFRYSYARKLARTCLLAYNTLENDFYSTKDERRSRSPPNYNATKSWSSYAVLGYKRKLRFRHICVHTASLFPFFKPVFFQNNYRRITSTSSSAVSKRNEK